VEIDAGEISIRKPSQPELPACVRMQALSIA
jgi:hypothetical protein